MRFPRLSPLAALGVGYLATLASFGAQAAVAEAVTTAITGAGTDAATVGAAVLVVIVGIKAFKWVRRAL